ncbi:type III-B CRISPR module RAMP protein Cmr1 [Shewanella putrefaciens]|uniref:type III-B CRISPR module RAMP protein Cmr1 n=1 Tax=Shewanella putrefaciens TaxID=24 RepID=UPI003D7BBD18
MRRQIKGELLDGLRDELKKEPSENEWITYQCTLVTPMFGGGVETGKVDKDMPIRASTIRGQLRFWWRIACGPKDPKVMREKEEAIWGGIGDKAAIASQVQIRVISKNVIMSNLVSSKKLAGSGVKYALGATDEAYCLPSGYNFVLEIRYKDDITSDQIKQVKESLRWWALFGGVGARTRRGFGAVEVKGVEPIPIHDFDDEQTNKGCKLAFAKGQYNDAKLAWEKATNSLYEFRQQPEIGRNKGKEKKEGRSFWPEADQLRYLTGKNDNGRHMPEFEKNLIFPRAAFGLPIQFQFPGKNNDPDKMNLYPEDSERLASPLILRPYLDENKKWRALALLLPNWKKALTQPLTLEPTSEKKSSNSRKVTYPVNHWPDEDQQLERDRLTNDIKPMKGRANDPLSAFLEYFKEGNS